MPASRRSAAPGLAALAALLVTALAGFAARSGPWAVSVAQPAGVPAGTSPPLRLPVPTAAGASAAATAAPIGTGGGVSLAVVVALVALLALAGVVLIVAALAQRPRWRRWRRRPEQAGVRPAEDAGGELPAAVDRALHLVDDVGAQPDAREAVVRAWLLLGEAAAAAGTPPRPAETAAEYAGRLAADRGLPSGGLQRLAALYREARFSGHEVGVDDRARARTELLALQAALRQPAGVPVRRAPR